MVSWLEELERRENSARERIAELRQQIDQLTARLTEQETVVSRLEITRQTMTEILSAVEDADIEDKGGSPAEAPRPAGPGRVDGLPIGVQLVPPWHGGLKPQVLPPTHRDIVEVLADAVHPLRVKHIAATLGLPQDRSKLEGLRSKLKLLAERGWLAEVAPGLFGTAPAGRADTVEGEGSRS